MEQHPRRARPQEPSAGIPPPTQAPAQAPTPPPAIAAGMPAYVRGVIEEAARAEITLLRRAPRPADPRPPLLISVVKNERAALGDLLRHYRRLGVTRFALIDNGSTDGSLGYLAAQPDVDLYSVRRPFPLKQGWINGVIARYGYDRWYVYVDADEHLVFDGAGARSLGDLVAFAEARGLRRVRGMLVDMYAPGPLLAAVPPPGRPLAESFPLFDGGDYRESLCLQRISRKGGPRKRGFSTHYDEFDPELSKYPLFHIRMGEVVSSSHHIYPYQDNYASPCFIGILHYKFKSGFLDKMCRAIEEENYWGKSHEYKRYFEVLSSNEQLTLAYAGTRAYGEPADLVASGLIEPIAWTAGRDAVARSWRDWARRARSASAR